MSNFKVIIKSQMRSGSHYLQANLCQAYELKPAIIGRYNDVIYKDYKFLNKGLHNDIALTENYESESALQFHYYHHPSIEIDDDKVLNLIGFPIDSFISDMGNYQLHGRSEVSSYTRNKNKTKKSKITIDSKAFIFFEKYIDMNAKWLNQLVKQNKNILRFEDFFISFEDTVDKIEGKFGKFKNKFTKPNNLKERTYWSDKYLDTLDIEVLKFMITKFQESLTIFYPEKCKILFSYL